ncbi:MAG: response regulator [Alphaproteobacteria bacterium]|nr:response regulator [Alphaproteobacteria bacterium]
MRRVAILVNAVRRILLTDDEPLVLQAIARNLRRHRPAWLLDFAQSGSEALALADRSSYDAYVMDCRMPGIDGIDAASALRRRHPQAACVMLTGHADLSLAMQAVNEAQAVRFLTKPCAVERLIEAIEAAIARHDNALAQSQVATPISAAAALGRMALERLPFAAFRLDLDGRLAEANDQGRRLIAEADVLVADPGSLLRAADASSRSRMETVRRRVASAGGTEIMRLCRRSDGAEIAAALLRIDGAAAATDIPASSLALFVTDPSRHGLPAPAALAAFFALTPSESRLTHALLRGLSLQEASRDVGITVTSARTYLRHIFAKLGIGRQSELIRAVLTSPIMFVGDVDAVGATDRARDA